MADPTLDPLIPVIVGGILAWPVASSPRTGCCALKSESSPESRGAPGTDGPRVREVVPRTPVAVRAVDARSPRDHKLTLGTEAVLPSDTEPHLTRQSQPR